MRAEAREDWAEAHETNDTVEPAGAGSARWLEALDPALAADLSAQRRRYGAMDFKPAPAKARTARTDLAERAKASQANGAQEPKAPKKRTTKTKKTA